MAGPRHCTGETIEVYEFVGSTKQEVYRSVADFLDFVEDLDGCTAYSSLYVSQRETMDALEYVAILYLHS